MALASKGPLRPGFTGLRQDERFLESDLENALIGKLQHFLLELGKGWKQTDLRLEIQTLSPDGRGIGPGTPAGTKGDRTAKEIEREEACGEKYQGASGGTKKSEGEVMPTAPANRR